MSTLPGSYDLRVPRSLSTAEGRIASTAAAMLAAAAAALILGITTESWLSVWAFGIAGSLILIDALSDAEPAFGFGIVYIGAGLVTLPFEGAQVITLAAAGALSFAWGAAELGRRLVLQEGVNPAIVKDVGFRALLLCASLAAAAGVGAKTNDSLASLFDDTPLESLTTIVSWAVAIGTCGLLSWTAWRAPAWLAIAQLRGRIEPLAANESMLFAVACSLALPIIWEFESIVPLEENAVIAIAASGAYAWCRLRHSTPAAAVDAPLWIVPIGEYHFSVDGIAASVASIWRGGQVTVLASPDAARWFGGDHLRAALLAGRGSTLFPKRAVQLLDWDDAQPLHWRALPVRELYAPPGLWSRILGERLDRSSRVLVLLGEPAGQVTGFFLPRSNGPDVRPDLTREALTPLATEIARGREAILDRVRVVRPSPQVIVRRHVLLLSEQRNAALAEAIEKRLHGAQDVDGRRIVCWKLPHDPSFSRFFPIGMQLQMWLRRSFVLAHRFWIADGRAGTLDVALRIGLRVFGNRDTNAELDVVVLDGADAVPTMGPRPIAIENGLRHRLVQRLVAIRAVENDADAALLYDARLYTGEIRVNRGDLIDSIAQQVALKLLALDIPPLSAPFDQRGIRIRDGSSKPVTGAAIRPRSSDTGDRAFTPAPYADRAFGETGRRENLAGRIVLRYGSMALLILAPMFTLQWSLMDLLGLEGPRGPAVEFSLRLWISAAAFGLAIAAQTFDFYLPSVYVRRFRRSYLDALLTTKWLPAFPPEVRDEFTFSLLDLRRPFYFGFLVPRFERAWRGGQQMYVRARGFNLFGWQGLAGDACHERRMQWRKFDREYSRLNPRQRRTLRAELRMWGWQLRRSEHVRGTLCVPVLQMRTHDANDGFRCVGVLQVDALTTEAARVLEANWQQLGSDLIRSTTGIADLRM